MRRRQIAYSLGRSYIGQLKSQHEEINIVLYDHSLKNNLSFGKKSRWQTKEPKRKVETSDEFNFES